MSLSIIILAAGIGKRMRSALPKVMQPVGGLPMLVHVIKSAKSLLPKQLCVIVGHGKQIICDTIQDSSITWVEQSQQLGTGDAVRLACNKLKFDKQSQVLILLGDVPLITSETLHNLLDYTPAHQLGLLSTYMPDPTGFGRVIRDDMDNIEYIVEEKDATDTERTCKEVNTGIFLMPAKPLTKWLKNLTNDNAQAEYYLTDVVEMAIDDGVVVNGFKVLSSDEVLGVNDPYQLAIIERKFQHLQAKSYAKQGVFFRDLNRVDIRGLVEFGNDCIIEPNVIIEGIENKLGNNVIIGANVYLKNVKIGNSVNILANSYLQDCIIADNATIGPFARIRPGTQLSNNVKVGNFVEIKNSILNENTKVNHLSYIGDATLGKSVNVGAGSITCNYDGVLKHRTIIGDGVQIGSNCQLVAPVSIGENAYIGAGTTVIKDAPKNELTINLVEQKTVEDWVHPSKR